MKIEIERKFLVNQSLWNSIRKPKGILIQQGYLQDDSGKTIRVRLKDDKGFLTIKGKSANASRLEYEYSIPSDDAREILKYLTDKRVEKIRYIIPFEGSIWEVDEFKGRNEGLFLAEIELQDCNEEFENPVWVEAEVTNDPRYYNSYLADHPFTLW